MTTVPNKMNKAEKMRDRRGIISRLQISKDVLEQQETSVLYIMCPSKDLYPPVVMQNIIDDFRQVIVRCIDPSDYKHL